MLPPVAPSDHPAPTRYTMSGCHHRPSLESRQQRPHRLFGSFLERRLDHVKYMLRLQATQMYLS